MSLAVFYSIVITLIGIQIKSISFLLRSINEMLCLVLVVMSKAFAATTGQRKRCRVKQVLFDHLYSMIGILNDLECDIKTTLQTPDCVWWDLIHEYNRKTFPLFKKHVTKQDKHAQSTSIAHVEKFSSFTFVLCQNSRSRKYDTHAIVRQKAFWRVWRICLLITNNTKTLKIHYMVDFTFVSCFLVLSITLPLMLLNYEMTLIIEFVVLFGLHLLCNDIYSNVHYIVPILYIIFKILQIFQIFKPGNSKSYKMVDEISRWKSKIKIPMWIWGRCISCTTYCFCLLNWTSTYCVVPLIEFQR